MPPLRDRPTQELVVLILTVTVSLILLVSIVMLLVIEVRNPGVEMAGAARSLGQVVGTLIAAIVGYIAGRGDRPGPPGH